MTEQEYKRWRQGKIMTGKHWTAMKEQVADELARVNKTALEYVNGRLLRGSLMTQLQLIKGLSAACEALLAVVKRLARRPLHRPAHQRL